MRMREDSIREATGAVRVLPNVLQIERVKMRRTGWYQGHQKPIVIGVYERETYTDRSILYSFFNGKKFMRGRSSIEQAMAESCNESCFQSFRWRGLAFDPEATK